MVRGTSLVPVRACSVAGIAAVLVLTLAASAAAAPVLTLTGDGSVRAHDDRLLPATDLPEPPGPSGRTSPRARSSMVARRTVRSELAALLAAEAIDQVAHDAYRAAYTGALGVRARLRGHGRAQLSAVLDNLEDVAAGGLLTAPRLPSLFLTLARNREWWTRGPRLAVGRRVTFAGSQLVWQHYARQGLQIQWLGTFGRANGLFQSGVHDVELRALLDEAIPLAGARAGGIAFEYLFGFGGGRAPWASGMAQATAIQALTRAATRFGEPRYLEAARAALGIYREGPPAGVRVATPAGAHYLIYSFAPGLRVLNAFTQTLNGLHDFARLAGDAEGRALFDHGDRQLRSELAGYDTGAWSRYSLRREADLHYHRLARDFLAALCVRLQQDLALPTGGTVPGADPAPYCETAARFTAYLSTPPVVRLLSRRVRAGKPAAVRLALSKPAFVSLAVLHRGRVIARAGARLGSGYRALGWNRPRRGGTYRVVLRATDLAGNRAAVGGPLRALRAK